MGLLKFIPLFLAISLAWEGGSFGGTSTTLQVGATSVAGITAGISLDKWDPSVKPAPTSADLAEKSRQLEELLALEKNAQGEQSSELLKKARDALVKGDADLAKSSLLEFLEKNKDILASLDDGSPVKAKEGTREYLKYLIEERPQEVAKGFSHALTRVNSIAWRIYNASQEEKLDTMSAIGRTLAFRRTAMQQRAITIFSDTFTRLSNALEKGDRTRLTQFVKYKNDLFYRSSQALEALASRWGTCEERAQDLSDSVDRFIATGKFYSLKGEQLRILTDFNERERDEQIRKEVYFTRENLAVGVATALAIAEVSCIVATAGICAAAAPGVWGTTMTVVRGTARAYAAVSAATDIVDRVRFDGAMNSISSFGFWVDVLVIMSTAPRPTLQAMKWAPQIAGAPSWINTLLGTFKPGQMLGMAQHQSGYMVLIGGSGYALWQFRYAERIARELTAKGIDITPSEVRRKAGVSLAVSMVSFLTMYHEYNKGVARYGNEYEEMIKVSRFGPTMQRVGKQLAKLLPWNPPASFVKNIQNFRDAPVMNSFRALGNLGHAAYNILFWTNTALLGISYADWNFHAAAAPMPALKEGEIALVLNGFADTDLLYYGFASDYSVRREIEKYGSSLYRARFGTPEDMIAQIEAHGKIGKIKYLAIETHGLPGRLYANAPGPEGGSEFIGVEYLAVNGEKIKAIMRQAMAKDANIRLISCLVGANFKKDSIYKRKSGEEIGFDERAGDHFMEAFGHTFMVNGGTVDSARRMILGADAIYGAFFNQQMEALMADPTTRHLMEIQSQALKLRLLSNPKLGLLAGEKQLTPEETETITGDVMVEVINHLKATYGTWKVWEWQIYEVIKVYGMDIEGGPFSQKHRRDVFPAQ